MRSDMSWRKIGPLLLGCMIVALIYAYVRGDLNWVSITGGLLGFAILAFIVKYVRRRQEGHERYCRARGFTFHAEQPAAAWIWDALALIDRDHSAPAAQRPAAQRPAPSRDAQLRATSDRAASWRRRARGATSSIEGQWNGVPFTALEYQYGSGRALTTVGVMLWKLSPDQRLPEFRLTPERIRDRIKQQLGAQDLDFRQDPEFSAAYQLQGPDEAGLRKLFTLAARHFLVENPGQGIASDGRHLVWWTPAGFLGRRALPSAKNLDRFFERGDRVRRLLLP